jgi:two-component system CheB/CheR fusion protein
MQSLNEELATVNNQLSDKVDELDRANADMTNLLAGTDIATMFLDRELRVQTFTPITGKLLNLIAADIGRPISDFSSSVKDESLVPDARRVLDELAPIEKEVLSDSSDCYLRRVVPIVPSRIASKVSWLATSTSPVRSGTRKPCFSSTLNSSCE